MESDFKQKNQEESRGAISQMRLSASFKSANDQNGAGLCTVSSPLSLWITTISACWIARVIQFQNPGGFLANSIHSNEIRTSPPLKRSPSSQWYPASYTLQLSPSQLPPLALPATSFSPLTAFPYTRNSPSQHGLCPTTWIPAFQTSHTQCRHCRHQSAWSNVSALHCGWEIPDSRPGHSRT